jgi:hypothetical protein
MPSSLLLLLASQQLGFDETKDSVAEVGGRGG